MRNFSQERQRPRTLDDVSHGGVEQGEEEENMHLRKKRGEQVQL